MPSLYSQKDSNIRKTYLLFSVFLLLIIGLGWFFSYAYNSPGILFFAVIFSSTMSIISYWHSDKIVLSMTHAVPVERKTNPEIYNIVENLAITAGLPTPKIYLTPEAAPNAFATGRDPQHSVIAVTSGLLNRLERPELEGVIAHELSHIGNRDMLFSTVAVILAGFISLIADFFLRSMLWGGNRRGNRENGTSIFFFLGIIGAILAPLAALLLRLAISRKREFLADANSALLTRYPEGLARALEKISRDPLPMKTANNATAHLWLANPFKGKQAANWLTKLFMTHPPIEERIKILRGLAF